MNKLTVLVMLAIAVCFGIMLVAILSRAAPYEMRFAVTPGTTPITVEIRWREVPQSLEEALVGYTWHEVPVTPPEFDPSCYRVQFDIEPGYFEHRFRDEDDRLSPWSDPTPVSEPPLGRSLSVALLATLALVRQRA